MSEITIDQLRAMLIECAGVAEGVDLDGPILDTTFEDLGYDSIALLETVARIKREHGTELENGTDARTPRELLNQANRALAAR